MRNDVQNQRSWIRRKRRSGKRRKRRRKRKEGEEEEGEAITGGKRREKNGKLLLLSLFPNTGNFVGYIPLLSSPPAMSSDSSFLLNHNYISLFSLFPHIFHFLQPNKNFLTLLCRTIQLFFEAVFLKSPYKSRCILWHFHSTLTQLASLTS